MMKFALVSRGLALFPAIAFGLCLSPSGCHAAAASATSWINSANSKVRLVSGTVALDGKPALVAGVHLRMDPGWKTYWKNPGDSGVPPRFDWSGSKNLKRAETLYPAPHRFADAGGTAIGYDGEIVFPVKLTPEREGEPIELNLDFAYGLCKDLCIPSDVSLSLAVGSDVGKGDAPLIETFLARVPEQAATGRLPAIGGIDFKSDGERPALIVDAHFPAGATGTDLFIDGGEAFVPVSMPLGAPVDGEQRFAVTFASASEAAAIKGKPLALTLVSDQGSTETLWTAD
jgi:DsbC/DsbD-like thiol-disulfide interchange protein